MSDPREADTTKFAHFVAETTLPVARFVGHSLAVSVGFILLTVILLIPVGAIHLLKSLGFDELAGTMHQLDSILVQADVWLFLLTLGIGALQLLATEAIIAFRQIAEMLRR